ncbi:MAG: D-2-hydroxyacid dehydrogenase [Lachnospiraceae bacterium]|nr:D-2-hydroxyacid dehydrogenase [Lachnospiraceae bacterium]
MKIVAADIDSVGNDIDPRIYDDLGEVDYYDDKITDENAEKRLKGAEVLLINKSRITESILEKAPELKLICEFATGYDNVDLKACSARGVKVANVVNYSTDSVVQHTFALAFYLLEHLEHYDRFVKSGEYSSQEHFCCLDRPFRELSEMTWGIVGMGNIGRRTAKIAESFGAKVIFYASSGHSDCTEFEQVNFDELLSRSDIISIHCPLSDKTRNLFGKSAFEKMKDSAILINVARGPVVNEDDLCEALNSGEIAAAGLDVLAKEPLPADSKLLKLQDSDKLIITPHMAWGSTEARIRCIREVKKNIEAWAAGAPTHIVND